MKKILHLSIFSIFLIFMTSCNNTSVHPIIKNRNALIATEIRINIYISDDISQAKIDNYPLSSGNNYIKVPMGTHTLFWNKKGENNTKEILINSHENKFILF